MALTCLTSSCCLKSPLWEKMSFLVSSLHVHARGLLALAEGPVLLQRAAVRKEL